MKGGQERDLAVYRLVGSASVMIKDVAEWSVTLKHPDMRSKFRERCKKWVEEYNEVMKE